MKKIYLILTLILALFLLAGCQEEITTTDTGSVEDTTSNEPSEPAMEKTDRVTYIVDITDDGFLPEELTIKIGDTIKWVNARIEGGSLSQVLIIGTLTCTKIKSSILKVGESYEYTFEKAETCKIQDGITSNQFSIVTVEGDVMEK